MSNEYIAKQLQTADQNFLIFKFEASDCRTL